MSDMINAGTRPIRDAAHAAHTSGAWLWIRRELGGLVRPIARPQKLFVASVNGPAAGVGLAFAPACDILFVSERALLVAAVGRPGLVSEAGKSWVPARRLGPPGALTSWSRGRPVAPDCFSTAALAGASASIGAGETA